jgi:hypothetical protein
LIIKFIDSITVLYDKRAHKVNIKNSVFASRINLIQRRLFCNKKMGKESAKAINIILLKKPRLERIYYEEHKKLLGGQNLEKEQIKTEVR